MLHGETTSIYFAATWGALVIISWVGYGYFWDRFLWKGTGGGEGDNTPIGLLAGWGMAIFICLGGFLIWLHLANRFALIILTSIGVVGGLYHMWSGRKKALETMGKRRESLLFLLPLTLSLLFLFLGGMQGKTVSLLYDDIPSYLPFVHELLETGGLLQPFSLRRIAAYGGHSLLQSQVLAGTSDAYLYFLETGICPVVMALLILALIRPKDLRDKLLALMAILVVLFYPVQRINSNCLATGLIIFLALFATITYGERIFRGSVPKTAYWLTLGLLSAAAAALRFNFIPAAGLVLLLYLPMSSLPIWKQRRQFLIGLALLAGIALVLLLPWAISLWEACATPLYPFVKGYYREIGLFSVKVPLLGILKYFFIELVPRFIWPFLLGLAFCADRYTARLAIPFYISAIVVTLMVIYFNPSGESVHAVRYSTPMLFAAEIGVIGLALGEKTKKWMRPTCMVVLVLLSFSYREWFVSDVENNVFNIRLAMARLPFIEKEVSAQYRQAQMLIPEGRRVLVMVNLPNLFDYSRNRIDLIDLPGTCSPDPGMPMMRPYWEFKDYLLKQGIEYVIYDDFDVEDGLYSRNKISRNFNELSTQPKILAPYTLYAMDAVEFLKQSGYSIGGAGALTVLHIH